MVGSTCGRPPYWASVAYLFFCRSSSAISLLLPMLETLPPLAESLSQPPLSSSSTSSSAPRTSNYRYLSTSLSTSTRLYTSHPILFVPIWIHHTPTRSIRPPVVGLHLQSDSSMFPAALAANRVDATTHPPMAPYKLPSSN